MAAITLGLLVFMATMYCGMLLAVSGDRAIGYTMVILFVGMALFTAIVVSDNTPVRSIGVKVENITE